MRKILLAAASAAAIMNGAGTAASAQDAATETAMPSNLAANPLIAEWSGPFGGVPAFDRMELDDLRPALEAGMVRQLAEIDAIATNPEPATFENTIVALERAGADLDRVFIYYGIWSSNLSSPDFREIQAEMAPRISAFYSQINQNKALFARVKAIHDGEELAALRPD